MKGQMDPRMLTHPQLQATSFQNLAYAGAADWVELCSMMLGIAVDSADSA